MFVQLRHVARPAAGEPVSLRDAGAINEFQAALRRDLSTDGWTMAVGPSLGGARKRALDIIGAVFGLFLVAPLIALAALLIRLQDGGPAFYGHERIGYAGRRFRCWKLRTMARDADQRLEQVLASDPLAALEWKARRKLTKDPRVTPLGEFLRRSSIDELPQFWNILKGDMSLIGPRPLTLPELNERGSAQKEYLRTRPGLSGLWQVSGRSEIGGEERVALDRDYVRNWSFKQDVWIILRTIPAIITRRGAC